MSAKEFLEEAITQANKDLSRLEENYYNLPPGEREFTAWGQRLEECIDCLRDAIDLMSNAYDLMEDDYD